ncbi:thiopurine S-methyltransferase (tpmt) superfamily protein [Mycobacterium tuberculosis]|nr:thiopurine S-methyltransferase (tpmt) superfamily protein [Mycobacterium tuberculosis]
MIAARNPDMAAEAEKMLERFRVMEPWLVNGRVHAPFWEVHATRVD